MTNEIDPYTSVLRIAEKVKAQLQQRAEYEAQLDERIAECKAQLDDVSSKFDKLKSILTQIAGMTDALFDPQTVEQ